MAREKQEFHRGTKVGVRFGGRVVPAIVVEDRGVFHGHLIVRVHLGDPDDRDAIEFELRAEELQSLPAAA